MEQLEIDLDVRGNYKSVDLYLLPQAVQYAELVETVLNAFSEQHVELIIDEHAMPLPYYEALEIPLDVFADKYNVQDGKQITLQTAVDLCRDLLKLGLFDIGFKGEKIAVFLSHDGYLNLKPLNIDEDEFKQTAETLRGEH